MSFYPNHDDDDKDYENCCFWKLFCVWCCPPWPTTYIPNGIFTPPLPTYCLTDVANKSYFIFFEKAVGCIYDLWKHTIDCFFAITSRGNRIACMFFRPVPDASHTIFYSHGNCSDLGTELTFCLRLGILIDCNVFSYDYCGYGASNGKPSEKNIFADVACAWEALHTRYSVVPENTVLFGRSLGTIPTVELAARQTVAAVVLLSPLTSPNRVVFEDVRRSCCCDAFPSIDKLRQISSRILVIHGTNDRVIHVSHGVSIYEKCPENVDPLWVEGAGHNDIQFHVKYLERLRRFATVELPINSSNESLEEKIAQLKQMKLYI